MNHPMQALAPLGEAQIKRIKTFNTKPSDGDIRQTAMATETTHTRDTRMKTSDVGRELTSRYLRNSRYTRCKNDNKINMRYLKKRLNSSKSKRGLIKINSVFKTVD
jgi:ADP-ribosylglycohydrolase